MENSKFVPHNSNKWIKYIALGISLIYDILIMNNQVPFYEVDSDYIKYVFAAIATVGALGSTVLSIILNVSDISCLGFSFKEILRFDKSPIKVQRMIAYSIGPIIVAMFFLALGFCTTMSTILIWTVYHIINCCRETWGMMSSTKDLEFLVKQEVEKVIHNNNINSIATNVTKWGAELEKAIIDNDLDLQSSYLELLIVVYSSQADKNENATLKTKIEIIIAKVFNTAVDFYGFSDSYNRFISAIKSPMFNNFLVIQTYLAKIQYGGVERIGALNLRDEIDNIIFELDADKNTTVYILYQYFNAINSNTAISTNLKYSALDVFFEDLCNFHDNAKNIEAQGVAIQLCFRDGILYNKDEDERNKLFDLIINNLCRKNIFSGSELFIQTIASIFRGMFFYLEYEIETVRESHRNSVRETTLRIVETTDNMYITLGKLVFDYSNKIIEFYIKDAIANDFGGIFDYFPEGFGCKSTTWTLESKSQFAFLFYLVNGYGFYLFPCQQLLDDLSIGNREKISFCSSIMALYNYETETIGENAKELAEKMILYLRKQLLPESYIKENFIYLNDLYKNISKEFCKMPENLDVATIQGQFEEQMAERNEIKLNTLIPLEKGKEYQIHPHFNRYYKDPYKEIARELKMAVMDATRQLVNEILPEIKLSFDQNGVNTLLEKLNSEIYKVCNYRFIDDLAIKKQVRESKQYLELKEKIKALDYIETREIGHVFLKSDFVTVNARVISYKPTTPTIEQCNAYLSNYKISEGRYNLDRAVYTTSEAVNWVQQNITVESAVFKVALSVDENSGFRIGFDYSKIKE